MRHDTDVRQPDADAFIRPRRDHHGELLVLKAAKLLGCNTERARADLFGVTTRTLHRLREDTYRPGEVFLSQSVEALRPHSATLARHGIKPTLDGLFEVVTDRSRAA